MNLGVVIPNYNGEELLRKNLPKVFEALASYKDGGVEIIVIDDSSADDSIDTLRKLKTQLDSKYPSIKFQIINLV